MTVHSRLAFSILALGLAASCAAIRADPPLHRRIGAFEVRGVEASLVELVAQTIERRRHAVQDELGRLARDVDRCEVTVQSQQGQDVNGLTQEERDDTKRIAVRIGSASSTRAVEATVVHELVHLYLGEARHRLPAIVEEGLCEWIAQRHVPESAIESRAEHLLNMATVIAGAFTFDERTTEGGHVMTWTIRARIDVERLPNPRAALLLSRDELFVIRPEENHRVLTSFGFLLVERIGLPRLVELVEQSRSSGDAGIPPEALFAAAGLDPHDTSRWMPAVRALASPEQILEAIRAPDSRIHLSDPPPNLRQTPTGRPELVRTARGG